MLENVMKQEPNKNAADHILIELIEFVNNSVGSCLPKAAAREYVLLCAEVLASIFCDVCSANLNHIIFAGQARQFFRFSKL